MLGWYCQEHASELMLCTPVVCAKRQLLARSLARFVEPGARCSATRTAETSALS